MQHSRGRWGRGTPAVEWRDIGGEIWIDLASRFSHVGSYVYRGDLGAALGEAQRLGRFG